MTPSTAEDPVRRLPGWLNRWLHPDRIANAHNNPNTVQTHFRGRDDTQTLNSATFSQTLNGNWTQNVDTTFRVRFEVEENGAAAAAVTGVLEANLNGGAFQDVTTTSSIVKAVASGQFTNGAATTNVITGSGQAFTAGTGSTTGDAADVTLTGQHTEWEYAVQLVGTDVSNGATVQLRVKGLNSYTNTPTVTGNNPNVSVAAEQPTAAGAGQDAGVSAAIPAEQPTAAGTGYDATVSTGGGGGGGIAPRTATGTTAETGTTLSNTSLACSTPAGLQNNDVLVALLVMGGSQPTITPPSGWTEIHTAGPINDTTTLRAQWWWKRWTTGDPTSYTWTVGAAQDSIAIAMMAYSGVLLSGSPIDAEAAVNETGTTLTSHVTPAITVNTADCWILTGFVTRNAETWTPPSGQTERAEAVTQANGGWRAVAELNDTGATVATGSQGGFTATTSVGTSTAAMFVAALKPEPAAGGTNCAAEAATATGTAGDAPLTIGPASEDLAPTASADNVQATVAPTAEQPTVAGTADNATVSISGATNAPADVATAVGEASDTQATVAPAAEQPTAASQGFDATVSTAAFTNAPAEQPTATGLASDGQTSIAVPAEQPAATGTAQDPTVSSSGPAPAEAAAAGGTGYNATISTVAPATVEIGAIRWVAESGTFCFAEAPAAAGTADNPQASIAVPAGQPTMAGVADDATVSTAAFTNAPAETATAVGTADNPQATIAPAAGQPTAVGAADDATVSSANFTNAPAGAATVTASTDDGQATVAPAAEQPTATGVALGASVNTSSQTNAQAEQPTATGVAYDATVSTSEATSAAAETATVTGAGQDPQAAIGFPAEQPTAAGVALNATVSTAAFTNCAAEAATAVGIGNDTTGVNATAGIGAATATGTADNAAVTFAWGAAAQAATATSSASDAQAAIAVLAEAAAVITAALDAIGLTQAVPGRGRVTPNGPTGAVTLGGSSGAVTVERVATGGVLVE